ncbi:MAG: hypothetical protein AAGJ09_00725 [Pseudomonadota bacterium]
MIDQQDGGFSGTYGGNTTMAVQIGDLNGDATLDLNWTDGLRLYIFTSSASKWIAFKVPDNVSIVSHF